MSTEHNPDNLTPEHNQDGWRRILVGEFLQAGDQWESEQGWEDIEPSFFGDRVVIDGFRRRITPDAGQAEAHEICGNLHCPAAHVTHYQGEHPRCLTCEGHGIIGGYEGSGNDMSPVGYPCPDCNPPAQQPAEAMPETETPIAYAIYGLDALGRHFLHDVRVPENDDWKSDDGGLGDRWTGNSPLYSIKQELEIRLTAALAEVERVKLQIEGERSRTGLAVQEIRKAISSRAWLANGERGLYEAGDAEYVKEFGGALRDIEAELSGLNPLIADLSNCPSTQEIAELGRRSVLYQEARDLRAQLTTERAAREQAEKNYKEAQQEIADAIGKAVKEHVERCNAERERDSLATRLAESESREHQAREALDIARKTIADFEDDIPLLDSECVEHIREAVNAIESALTAKSSTTVADLRKRVETAERERDAVVKALKDARLTINHAFWKAEAMAESDNSWHAEAANYATRLEAIDAAIATTQETK